MASGNCAAGARKRTAQRAFFLKPIDVEILYKCLARWLQEIPFTSLCLGSKQGIDFGLQKLVERFFDALADNLDTGSFYS